VIGMMLTFPDDTTVGYDEVCSLLITVSMFLLTYCALSLLLD
jgi:hypothetical protein